MFSSIVVPLDLEPHGDRALPIARRLAATAGIPLELVTVSSPALTEEVDRYELERRGRAGDVPWTATILHDNDPAAAIVGFVAPTAGSPGRHGDQGALGHRRAGARQRERGSAQPRRRPVPAHRTARRTGRRRPPA